MGLYLCYIKHLFFHIVDRLSIIQYNCFMRFFFESLREILVLDIASRIRFDTNLYVSYSCCSWNQSIISVLNCMLIKGALDWGIIFWIKFFLLGYVSFQSLIGWGSASIGIRARLSNNFLTIFCIFSSIFHDLSVWDTY